MKIACIYHSVDLDGWMSAAIVKYYYTVQFDALVKSSENKYIINNSLDERIGELHFIGLNHGDTIPDLSEYDHIIMCDFSLSKETMEQIAPKLVWIDHHISAMKMMDESEKFNSNVKTRFTQSNYAACELTWFHFFPDNTIPEIVRLLGRYDCFGHKGTKEEKTVLEFQYGARSVIANYEDAYNKLIQCVKPQENEYWFLQAQVIVSQIRELGAAIYVYLCTEAKQTYKNGFEIKLGYKPGERTEADSNIYGQYRFICINKERFNPINFGIDYHKDGYDGCACFYYDGKYYNFSLYNDNGEVDCSVIAKQFGGGGHKGASGMRLTPEQFLKLIR